GTLNIGLRDSARFAIRGQVTPPASGTRILFAPRGSDLADANFADTTATGAFEIRGVSPGVYLLLARTIDGLFSSDVVAGNVTDRDMDGARLSVQQTPSIFGGIFVDRSARTILSELHVKLHRSSTEFDETVDVPVAGDGAFTLPHVAPWVEYDIAVETLPPG